MKTVLTAIAAALILAGCETTTTAPTEHVYDQAATIGQSDVKAATKPPQESTKTAEVSIHKKNQQPANVISAISRTRHDADQFDQASTIGESRHLETVAQASVSSSLERIIEQSWRFRNHLDQHDQPTDLNVLEDLSPAALAKKHQQHLNYLKQLDNIERSTLTPQDDINWQILRNQIQELADQYSYKQHYYPLTSEHGFHIEIAQLSDSINFNQIEDFENYLGKLSQVKRYFAQQIDWMKLGLKSGYSQPKVALKGFEQTISNYITDSVEQSHFYRPFKQIKLAISASDKANLQNRARQIIEQQVIPQYQAFYDFMTQEYLVNARQTIGAAAMPNGLAFYNNRVRHYTTLDMDAEQVHQLGLQEVARIKSEMATIIKDLEFAGSFADFLHFLRTDPQFYAKTPEQLLEKAAWLAKKADAILPRLFNIMPRTPYGVEAVPAAIAPKYTTGRYKEASNDNEPGYYWVNTYALDKRPLYVLPSLTLHEAVPGHHLQISLNRELKDLPEFRRKSYISAFGEGWGLYSEYLGVEANYYSTAYEKFGRLTYEMWRACRLVVDTGIHAKGWSRQQVLDYMADNTALSLHNIKTETDRYISWPGQALSYKIGELTIKRLRHQAEQRLGDKFDLKQFHQRLLAQGSVPLTILEQQIDQYIKDNT
jgi:uncharacterized protein (DUF885 family)